MSYFYRTLHFKHPLVHSQFCLHASQLHVLKTNAYLTLSHIKIHRICMKMCQYVKVQNNGSKRAKHLHFECNDKQFINFEHTFLDQCFAFIVLLCLSVSNAFSHIFNYLKISSNEFRNDCNNFSVDGEIPRYTASRA